MPPPYWAELLTIVELMTTVDEMKGGAPGAPKCCMLQEFIPPPAKPAVLPEMVVSVMMVVPTLLTPPPSPPVKFPEIVEVVIMLLLPAQINTPPASDEAVLPEIVQSVMMVVPS